jgi:hypothetical protein
MTLMLPAFCDQLPNRRVLQQRRAAAAGQKMKVDLSDMRKPNGNRSWKQQKKAFPATSSRCAPGSSSAAAVTRNRHNQLGGPDSHIVYASIYQFSYI